MKIKLNKHILLVLLFLVLLKVAWMFSGEFNQFLLRTHYNLSLKNVKTISASEALKIGRERGALVYVGRASCQKCLEKLRHLLPHSFEKEKAASFYYQLAEKDKLNAEELKLIDKHFKLTQVPSLIYIKGNEISTYVPFSGDELMELSEEKTEKTAKIATFSNLLKMVREG